MFAFLSPSAKYNWLLCQFILNQIPLKKKKKSGGGEMHLTSQILEHSILLTCSTA